MGHAPFTSLCWPDGTHCVYATCTQQSEHIAYTHHAGNINIRKLNVFNCSEQKKKTNLERWKNVEGETLAKSCDQNVIKAPSESFYSATLLVQSLGIIY